MFLLDTDYAVILQRRTGTFPVGDEAGWVGHFVRQMVGRNVTRMCHFARARARAQRSFS